MKRSKSSKSIKSKKRSKSRSKADPVSTEPISKLRPYRDARYMASNPAANPFTTTTTKDNPFSSMDAQSAKGSVMNFKPRIAMSAGNNGNFNRNSNNSSSGRRVGVIEPVKGQKDST